MCLSSLLEACWRRRRHVKSHCDKVCGWNFVFKGTIHPRSPFPLPKKSAHKEIGTQSFQGLGLVAKPRFATQTRLGKLCVPLGSFGFFHKSQHKELAHKVFFRPLGREKTAVEKLCVPVLAQEKPEKTPEFEIILPGMGCSSTNLNVDAGHPSIPPSNALMLY